MGRESLLGLGGINICTIMEKLEVMFKMVLKCKREKVVGKEKIKKRREKEKGWKEGREVREEGFDVSVMASRFAVLSTGLLSHLCAFPNMFPAVLCRSRLLYPYFTFQSERLGARRIVHTRRDLDL